MERAVRTLVLWCPDWPVSAAMLPAGDPVAVVAGNQVVACSAGARAEGVCRGLRRREAQSRCPELVVIAHDPGRDARAFERVLLALETFTPRIEVLRPGMAALATRGPSRYFGGDQALATAVSHHAGAALLGLGIEPGRQARVGVADGPFAAGLATRDSTDTEPTRVVPPGGTREFLAPLSLRVLDRPGLVDLLSRLGLHTLGDLAELPTPSVLARFGPEGEQAQRLARGLDERPLAARVTPPELSVTTELDPPAQRVDQAAFAAKFMADELHSRLAGLGLCCTRLSIQAETEHGEHLVRLWRHEGSLSAGHIAERVRWQLDSWLRSTGSDAPTAGLSLLRLVPDEVIADHGRQLGFWGSSAAADDRAARAMARVQGLLGPASVLTAVIGGGRGPADQARLVPWGDPRVHDRSLAAPWPGSLGSPGPALVHCPSRRAEVLDCRGTVVAVSGRGSLSAPPATLSIEGGVVTPVERWAGPWLVEERWWDRTGSRRARMQLGLIDGRAHLVALEDRQWRLEATYD
jgi:protein ImuB